MQNGSCQILGIETWERDQHYPIRHDKNRPYEGDSFSWGDGGLYRPEALLNLEALWWWKNAHLILIYPGGNSCALSQEHKREEGTGV